VRALTILTRLPGKRAIHIRLPVFDEQFPLRRRQILRRRRGGGRLRLALGARLRKLLDVLNKPDGIAKRPHLARPNEPRGFVGPIPHFARHRDAASDQRLQCDILGRKDEIRSPRPLVPHHVVKALG
jgi:hypothetical protein